VVCVGPIPPPVHGASLVTAAVIERLAEAAPTKVVDVSPRGSGRLAHHASRASAHLRATLTLVAACRSHRTLYASLPGGSSIWYFTVIFAVARVARYRIVVHHHSFAYVTTPSRALAVATRFAGRDARHVVLCGCHGHRLEAGYRAIRTTIVCTNAWVVQPALPGASAQRSTRPTPGRLVIGHLANLSVDKGLGTVVALAERLLDDGLDVELRLAGPCADEAAARIVAHAVRVRPERVSHAGPLYGAAKAEWFESIDVFVFPSTYANEAAPLVVEEALAAGAATATTDLGCMGTETSPRIHDAFAPAELTTRLEEWARSFIDDPPDRDAVRAWSAQRRTISTGQLDALVAGLASHRGS